MNPDVPPPASATGSSGAAPLVFLHIPKTAGTTLHKILVHQVSRRQTLAVHCPEGEPSADLRRQLLREQSGGEPVRLVLGHLGMPVLDLFPAARCITCLREPVARVLSHFQHARHDPSHYLHEVIQRHRLDLAGYVSGGWSGEVSNGMVRALAGVADFHGAAVDGDTLAAAKTRLRNRFLMAGLTERFDESVLLLQRMLGWRTPWYIRRKVGAYDAAAFRPDAATRRVVEEHNQLDLELYEFAGQWFETLLRERLPEIGRLLPAFRARNRSLGPTLFCARELCHRAGLPPWF